ncbi:hypothetical protein BDW02DRAFT_571279 [Decorospora gaudefroyi]|uniref:Vacuolar import and degradation protein-domain-containing protein n=1 Tax=Decorospora gaudefroyi TaxID=184978 RepID=A0A6A5KFV9_9PLEO|nr:hypothetical protein BDW02DRAFT_571279 [Decorospora gaudefroyi]
MPPSNSPDPDTRPSFISALRELETAVDDDVLNLAATLGTQTVEEIIVAEGEEIIGGAAGAEAEAQGQGQGHDDVLRQLHQRDRLRRVMSRLSRLSDHSSAYGDRVPSQNSLYDWSPASEAGAGAGAGVGAGAGPAEPSSSLRSTAILQSAGVRRPPRFSARTRERETLAASRWSNRESPERDRSASRTSLDRERRDMLSRAESYRRSFLDRTASASAHPSTHANSSPAVSPMLEQTVNYLSRIRHSTTIDESVTCALEAGFLSKDDFSMQYADFVAETFTIPPPAETSWLAPGAVLSGCQHATSMATTVSTTRASTSLPQFTILDRATPIGGSARHAGLPPPIRPWIWNPTEVSPNRTPPLPDPAQDKWPVKVTIHDIDWEAMSLSATMEAYNVPSHPHSHASPPVTRTSSITTYLEGEILDFNTHTLLTESFKSSAATDAMYWRKLPPFRDMSDDEVVHALTSRKWLAQVLGQEWILMRWKERCFVKSLNRSTADPAPVVPPLHHTPTPAPAPAPAPTRPHPTLTYTHSPYRIVRNAETGRAEVEITPLPDAEHATFDDSGCGLTISGFYFVVLERRTGVLEGLYYDPQSSPYQCLRLESVRGGLRGAWAFR